MHVPADTHWWQSADLVQRSNRATRPVRSSNLPSRGDRESVARLEPHHEHHKTLHGGSSGRRQRGDAAAGERAHHLGDQRN
jgi:hypothetical protein